ncbi:MAG: hypothetical protein KDG52_03730 [Rhodocyclaceae bacterium]|nr:hypothetical protein [Rhodocyclaceae bacterium]
MQDVAKLLQTVSGIYSAPGNPDRWHVAMEEVCALVGARMGAYMLISAEDQRTEGLAYCGVTDEHVQRYAGYGGPSTDIRFKYIDRLIAGKVFRDFEYVPSREEYDASPWIQYQFETTGTYWCMTALISTHRLWNDFISVNRLKRLGPTPTRRSSTCRTCSPI